MGLLDDFLAGCGVSTRPATPVRPRTEGVRVRLERDLAPALATGLVGGHLLEAHAVLDERHEIKTTDKIRIDLVEQDLLGDDVIVSLVGTGTPPPATPSVTCTTVFATVPDGRDLAWVVDEHRRTETDFTTTILVVTERPATAPSGLAALRRTHVIGWLRPSHDDVGGVSEFVAVLDVAGAAQGTSAAIEVGPAVAGVAVRVSGALEDADASGTPPWGGLPEVKVTLGGRRAVSGADGRFAIDARLAGGTHPLRIARPGITPREFAVEIALTSAGVATATLLDGTTAVVTGTTPGPATPASVVPLVITTRVRVYVHKLRGTVLWPDSREATSGGFRRTPLAERRVYVLPLPDGADIAAFRPLTTRRWEQLKYHPDVLASARIDAQPLRERTSADGRFEVRYVDLTAGKRYLLWVEHFDAGATDTVKEAPEHVVRTETAKLRRLHRTNLGDPGRAGTTYTETDSRKVVDHEYNLTRDPVSWGLDALRVENFGGSTGVRLIRPTAASRATFDAAPQASAPRPPIATVLATPLTTPPTPAAGPPNPPPRVVDIDLEVLPIVPLHEEPGTRAGYVQRAAAHLVSTARAMFPAGHDLSRVRLAVDVRLLASWIPLGDPTDWHATDDPEDARPAGLLESTFVLREDHVTTGTGTARVTGLGRAKWHVDADRLADRAYIRLDGGEELADRTLDTHGVVPLFAPVAPVLAALAPRPIYLAPGHGLWWRFGVSGSAEASWWSKRGGYAENAGEDEVDALMARTVCRLLEDNAARVHACREIRNLSAPGVSNPTAGTFTEVHTATYPRLWQQNPVYAFGALGTTRLTGHSSWATWGAPPSVANESKDGHGVYARVEHIRSLARDKAIALVVALHTNAGGGRGTMVEYLNAHPPKDPTDEGNPLGFGLATFLANEIHARTGIRLYRTDGVLTMFDVKGAYPVRDLVDTYDHWALHAAGVPEQDQERVAPGEPDVPSLATSDWKRHPFPSDTATSTTPKRLPVALVELAFHDHPIEAKLLSRQWFRQRASEAVALAIDSMLRGIPGTISRDDVRAVLGRLYGQTAAVRALPAGAVDVTDAGVAMVLRSLVADPADIPGQAGIKPLSTLGGLADEAVRAAKGLTRRQLADIVADAVRGPAGWEIGDPAATLERWVTEQVSGPEPLARPGDIPTRAEAGEFGCRAIGLAPAGLHLAQTKAVGSPAIPLVDPAPGAADAWFPRVAAELLFGRIRRMTPGEVHRVSRVTLADGGWRRLSPATRGDRYDLHEGTPVTLLIETAGVPWKTAGQGVFPDLADVEIVVTAAGRSTTLACLRREPRRVVSGLWFPQLGPTPKKPADVTVELRLRHRVDGWLSAGTATAQLNVLATPAP